MTLMMPKAQVDSEFARIPGSIDPIIRQIVCGARHTFILKESGELFTFGWNGRGQLGLGDYDDRNIPTLLITLTPKAQVESEFARIPDSTDDNIVSINGVKAEKNKWDPKKYFTLSNSMKKIIKNFLLVCHYYKKKYNINMVKNMRHFIISLLF